MRYKEIFLQENTLITSKTDTKGNITYCNADFIKYSKMTEKELLGQPHNIIRHPYMPKVAFKALWDTIKTKNEFFAFVCNLNKEKETYWVFANVTPSLDNDGNIVGYYSVRRKPSAHGIKTLSEIYKQLNKIEKDKNLSESEKFLVDFLQSNNIQWNKLMIELQNTKNM
ncbi:PAS domain-containing protein [Helicobacter sp. WB40]|uniref:PAS domain-containing protein n=1 Tax=Helicobacter sp. WB40 TaxID=3004130 RepID=UPI0022EBB311|nr:PAS domain-containing protein [Helicobacter sp. WB40]MDA3966728.1 PAS domain-containing protein [Helicobacter sp. WB40]